MKTLFFNAQHQWRNGWWILLFIAAIVITQPVYRLITSTLRDINAPSGLVDAISPLMILLVTALCLKLQRRSMTSAGLALDRNWWLQMLVATLLGCVWLGVVALAIWLFGGIAFSLNPDAGATLLLTGLYTFFLAAAIEELLHRGFIFQRLIDGIGIVGAQILIAAIFAFGHLNNPAMEGWVLVTALTDLALASLVYGLAFWRTGSLALPLGLHLGWNWMQGSVLGIAVSGHETAGWLNSTLTDAPTWLNGGAFGIEASLLSPLCSLLVLAWLWRWRPNPSSWLWRKPAAPLSPALENPTQA